ncbi:MAG TPA: hypothetical protein PKA63_12970 [Oligoflexia bacterium]|nr:hypothetical protein [Oligoflexia bacterium]HMP49571.1 hypothetical protein [Oligoflexia bacterium]
MDLYRFFHPHHNARLRKKPLRVQEVCELQLAARELLRALEAAALRIKSINRNTAEEYLKKDSSILIDSSLNALELTVELLQHLIESLPEDSEKDMLELLKERENAPGWDAWRALLNERLTIFERSSNITISDKLNNILDLTSDKTITSHNLQTVDQNLALDDSSTSVSTLNHKKSISA